MQGSASREAFDRQACSRRQWHVLTKRRNAADERFTIRPKGATQMLQYSVAALDKDEPLSTDCALSWNIWVALNPTLEA